jgi:uncharacterized iron-regulated membrane protein
MTRSCGVLVHRDAGLSLARFLVVAGLTDSLSACHHEVDLWLRSTVVFPGAPRTFLGMIKMEL